MTWPVELTYNIVDGWMFGWQAGSTLLAFGNGSPDVFSTFASMGAHSGSLAIGELLGAASFIISVVAGVMMLVRPFKVTKHVFLRDVAFFMAADVLVCLILYDSHITQLEATGLVLLYVLYVAVVGCSSLWHSRRQRQKELLATARDNYAEDPNSSSLSSHSSPEFTPFLDEGAPGWLASFPLSLAIKSTDSFSSRTLLADERPPNSPDASTPRSRRSLRQQDYFGDQIEDSSSRPSLRNRSISLAAPAGLSRPRPSAMVRPSLLGAIEFRDVVHSLAQNSSQKALSQFAPISPARTRPRSSTRSRSDYNAASHHNHGHRRATSLAGGVEQLTQNQGPVFDPSVWERPVGSTTPTDLIDLSSGVEDPWRSSSVSSAAAAAGSTPLARPQLSVTTEGPEDGVSRGASALRRVPSIVLTGDDGNVTPMRASSEGSSSPSSARRPAPSRRPSLPAWAQSSDRPAQTRRLLHSFRVHLFPALQDVHQKSYLGLIAGVLSAPAIMMLTLTLPVVDEASFDDSFSEAEEKAFQEAQEDRAHGYEAESEPEDEAERLLWKDRARQRDERIAHRLHSPVAPSHSPSPTSATPPPLNLSELDRQLAERGEADQSVWQWPVDPSSSTGADECGTRTPPSPAPSLSQEARLQSEKQRQTDVKVEKFITVLDCVLCPFFCVLALLGSWTRFLSKQCEMAALGLMMLMNPRHTHTGDQLQWWFFLVALGCSVGLGFMAHTIVSDSQCRGRVLFCVVGFLVSMVWLLLTVNEIVGVLQVNSRSLVSTKDSKADDDHRLWRAGHGPRLWSVRLHLGPDGVRAGQLHSGPRGELDDRSDGLPRDGHLGLLRRPTAEHAAGHRPQQHVLHRAGPKAVQDRL